MTLLWKVVLPTGIVVLEYIWVSAIHSGLSAHPFRIESPSPPEYVVALITIWENVHWPVSAWMGDVIDLFPGYVPWYGQALYYGSCVSFVALLGFIVGSFFDRLRSRKDP